MYYYQPEAEVLITIISYECRWGLTVFYLTRFQALIIVHYAQVVTLSMALNLPINTLGLIITYNVLNLEILSYTGFWGLTTIYYQ